MFNLLHAKVLRFPAREGRPLRAKRDTTDRSQIFFVHPFSGESTLQSRQSRSRALRGALGSVRVPIDGVLKCGHPAPAMT